MSEAKKYEVLAKLESGADKRELSEEYGISYATVMRWHKEYKKAKEEGTLDRLLNMDKLVLALAEHVSQAPIMKEELTGAVSNLTDQVKTLQNLQGDFVTTAVALNTQIKSRVLSCESTSELNLLAETLVALQNAFFNKNSVQVNVQNNIGGDQGSKYGDLLSDKPTHN